MVTKKDLPDELKVYTSQEVADILQVDEMTIRRYIKAGKLKKLDTIGAIRISHKELGRLINGEE
jgi:excisionase family DNA binding protein